MLLAVFVLAVFAVSADVWRRRGGAVARLAAEAREDLRDALKAEAKAAARAAYEPGPTWWGFHRYAWWEDGRTIYVQPAPAPAQPAPRPLVEVGGVSAAPAVAPPAARPGAARVPELPEAAVGPARGYRSSLNQ